MARLSRYFELVQDADREHLRVGLDGAALLRLALTTRDELPEEERLALGLDGLLPLT